MTNQVIVTVKESGSMPGRFFYAISVNNRRISSGRDCGRGGPEAAAAHAVEMVMNHPGNYCILRPKKVLDCIPESIRSGFMK